MLLSEVRCQAFIFGTKIYLLGGHVENFMYGKTWEELAGVSESLSFVAQPTYQTAEKTGWLKTKRKHVGLARDTCM